MSDLRFALDINPEPWAVGPLGTARREGKVSAYIGRNQQLAAYQEAIQEGLKAELDDEYFLLTPPFDIEFYFWRNHAEYLTPAARKHRKHIADATNMQKATEDALQGVLFENDKDVARIRSQVVDQGPHTQGLVVIRVVSEAWPEVPAWVGKMRQDLMLRQAATERESNSNVWPPRD